MKNNFCSDSMLRRYFSNLGISLAVCLLLALAAFGAQGSLALDKFSTTQIPYLARFSADKEAAAHLSRLAEFSIQLLRWRETDRDSILSLQRRLKLEGYRLAGLGGKDKRLTVSEASKLTSKGYWSLQSPHLLKIEVGEEISAMQKPDPVRLMRGVPYRLPVILRNSRDSAVSVMVTSTHGRVSTEIVRLRRGQTEGVFLPLELGDVEASSVVVEVKAGDESRSIPLSTRMSDSGRLKVKVVDEVGQETPARVYLTGADGRAYIPEGSLPRVTNGDYSQPYGGDFYFYTTGRAESPLPSGEAFVEVVKGLEYKPFSTGVSIRPGKTTTLEVRLEKPWDLRKQGWYSGDTHLHPNVYDNKLISPEDVLRIVKAEDLNVSHLLACNDVSSHINERDRVEGSPHRLSEDNYILYWNQEFRRWSVNDHMGFLRLKQFIEPGYVGWEGTPYPYDYPPNQDFALKARSQGAAVIYVHPGLPSEYPVGFALGIVDAIDVVCQRNEEVNTRHWYQLLNCGFRSPISAGTDSFLDTPYHLIPGAGRVYVKVGPQLSYDTWIEAYLAGRSFATNGPLLRFRVNGKEAGEEIHWDSGKLQLTIEAEARSHVPMERVDLIVNGQVAASQEAQDQGSLLRMNRRIEIEDSAWVAVRVYGPGHRLVTNDTVVYAHSSPVYCYRSGRQIRSRKAAQFFIEQIDLQIENVKTRSRFRLPSQRDDMIRLFRRGQDVYRRIAEEAIYD